MTRFLGLAVSIAIALVFSPIVKCSSAAGLAVSELGNPSQVAISGELKQWHDVTLTVDGPQASEEGDPNPFMDFRMQVTFHHPATGLSYSIPGYFAADGNAANTSATSGNKWRVHLSPDHTGEWTYSIAFRQGPSIAVSDDPEAGSPVANVDGLKGSFEITNSDKTGRDFRGKGRLNYVGKHHLRFAGTGEYFLKAGVDAPENLFAYTDFDGKFKSDGHKDNLLKNWQPHVRDWKPGDPTWKEGKGKGLIGAINYLSAQGLNAFSFLTLNIDGDDCNVFPYIDYDERSRIDCSRMDQWGIVMSHGTRLGMYLHFKTQEAENVNLLDDGNTGPQRKLYYRELIARFGHHLALNWNLGEEVGYINEVSTSKKISWADYFFKHDPYHHHIVIHNGNKHYDMLGDASALTGFSLQTSQVDFRHVHGSTLNYLRRSVKAGKPWVVACDEPGDASHSLIPDAENPTHDNARTNALWGNLMAGGAGVEWYFGYKHAHSDLTCQDFRAREAMWKQSGTALQFFADNQIPFWEMTNTNNLLGTKDGYCFSKAGKLYLAFLKKSEPTTLDLSCAQGLFEIKWFDPRSGGKLQPGSIQTVKAGGITKIGIPSKNLGQDWLAVIQPADPNRDYAPGASAGRNKTTMLPRGKKKLTIHLDGQIIDDQSEKLSATWTQKSGPGNARFANAHLPQTDVTLEAPGSYVFALTASDGKQETESLVTIVVEPFQSRVTRVIKASDCAYLEGTDVFNNQHLKIEGKRRTSFIKFNLEGLPPNVLDVQLQLTEGGDPGSGIIQAYRGSHSDWDGKNLSQETAPKPEILISKQAVNVGRGESISLPVASMLKADTDTYTVIVTLNQGGNDIWFGSKASNNGPQLMVTFEDPDNRFASFGKAVGSTAQAGNRSSIVLSALSDFQPVDADGFVPMYRDKNQQALAIDASQFQDKFAAAELTFSGKRGNYDLVLTTLAETDGESVYRVLVGGKKIGEARNPETSEDYSVVRHRFPKVKLNAGAVLRVEFNSASNGKIPEGDAFAYSRGRWRTLTLQSSNGSALTGTVTNNSAVKPSGKPFKFNYDPTQAKKVHQQTDGIIVIEAEDFDAVNRQTNRKWYLTSDSKTPNIEPDPDPNHAAGASGKAYLELLPDTRVTHADPLVNGVSFTNSPGQCSVLYYPVNFKKAGRYYVWVRMCCTGSEDNGLHVGIDGSWPDSGARLQFTGKHGQWQWDSRQRTQKVHTGVLGKIWVDVPDAGLHTIMFSMREDGFEFDKFMLTPNQRPMKSKSLELGPNASPAK